MRNSIVVGLLVLSLFSGMGMVTAQESQYDDTFVVTYNETSENIVIDGKERPQLNLTAGATYKFEVDTNGHPFHISTDSSFASGETGIYQPGVNVTGSENYTVSNGTLIWEVPSSGLPDAGEMYYETSDQEGVGGFITVVSVGAVSGSALPVVVGEVEGVPYWLIGAVGALLLVVQHLWLTSDTEYL